jgi:hypothetical protein
MVASRSSRRASQYSRPSTKFVPCLPPLPWRIACRRPVRATPAGLSTGISGFGSKERRSASASERPAPTATRGGERFAAVAVDLCRWQDGKVVEEFTNWDTLGMLQQLGAVPEMARA